MLLKWGLFLSAVLTSAPLADDAYQIESQIKQLKELQEKYRFQSEKNVNNAMRWQFQSENYLDARRAWDRAAQDRQKIKEIQDQINDLEELKQKKLQKNEKSSP